ncbi:MAG: hypothetical protein EXQ52_01240 [Bryobacterales bacterium]|nr:hypothetical protein [Bryobacterales bacterium]
MFASAMPEWLMARMGKVYRGRPMRIKRRKELLATIRKPHWRYLREDAGDLPDGWADAVAESAMAGAGSVAELKIL